MKNNYKDPILYKVLRPIIKFLVICLFRPKIIGKENIPSKGRIVLAGNHTSVFDCFLLISCTKRCVHFLAKHELVKGPKKLLFYNMGIIPVNRKIHDHGALESAEEVLKKEMVIGIFPEGTTEKGRGLLPFKIGAVKMAYDTDTKVVPFSITGKYNVLKSNVKIIFEKPIKVNGKDLDEDNKELRDKISFMIGENN